jgi:hypothetical protein
MVAKSSEATRIHNAGARLCTRTAAALTRPRENA